MDYILKASAVLFIFYACYQLFLQKETFFQANRWFLLSGLIISCVIPLVVIPVYIEYTVTNNSNFLINYDNLTPTQTIIEEPFDYMQLIIWTYFAGILFFFGKLIVDFLSLRKVINSSKTILLGSFKLLETNRNITPFSFFDRIVYNPKQFENEELEHIINHEKVHTQQLHSIDTIMSQITCILFWFNPIAWLYKKALQQNLEFIADRQAQHISPCEKSYQTVLLKASVQNHQLAITNNFYTSLIKKRIVMLHKSKSNKINQLKFALVLPILAFFMMSFNTKDIYVEKTNNNLEEDKLSYQIQDHLNVMFNKNSTDEYLSLTKKQLSRKGITFNYKNIKRNDKNELTGIKVTFESSSNNTEYKISGNEPIKPFSFMSDGQSFKVVTMGKDNGTFMFTSKEGDIIAQTTTDNTFSFKQKDTISIQTQSNRLLKEGDSIFINKNSKIQTWVNNNGTNINASGNGNSNIYTTQSEEPLFVLDGKIVKKSTVENMDSENIESVNILKGNEATKTYGNRGKNGVILYKTKDKNPWKISDNYTVETFETDESKDSVIHKVYKKTWKNDKINNFTSTTFHKDKPLYIVDGNVVSHKEFKLVNPDNIESMHVLKDENAIELYGEKGKNGVIIIKSKIYAFVNGSDKAVVVEVEDNNPWKIKTAVTTVIYEDDNGKVTAEYILTKNSSDSFLEKQKQQLQKHGIEAKFSKVRRNKTGEITSIKISLDDNDGRKSSATWKDKSEAIPDIVMGKSSDDKLYVRAIGN